MKHHSYTGASPYLNIKQMMNGLNQTINVSGGGGGNNTTLHAQNYQKFIENTAGLDRGTSNITNEEIAALYSNVLATQSIISNKRSGAGALNAT